MIELRYLTKTDDIGTIISHLASHQILWVDTEIARWNNPCPKLSLIQVLATSMNLTTDGSTYILDVLDKPELTQEFIDRIVVNPKIKKVFHGASFDLRYLGGKRQAKNVLCTLQMAEKIPLNILGTSNRKLKTLATELCRFTNVDTEEQASDWGRRPLTQKQLNYAKMDTVYLAAVHQYLLKIIDSNNSRNF